MAKVIWKYQIPLSGVTLMIPQGAKILSIQEQAGKICLWVLVDPVFVPVERRFAVYGTGFDLPSAYGEYVGTVQISNFVWHVFEEV